MPDVGVDVPDVDVGMELPDATHVGVDFLQGLGATTVRLTNFGRVPVVLWGGVFAVAYWSLSYGLWHNYDVHRYDPIWLPSFSVIGWSVVNSAPAIGASWRKLPAS